MNDLNAIALLQELTPASDTLNILMDKATIQLSNVNKVSEAPFLFQNERYMLVANGTLPVRWLKRAVEIYQISDTTQRYVMVLVDSKMHTVMRNAFTKSTMNKTAE